jgi:hypothetical protein
MFHHRALLPFDYFSIYPLIALWIQIMIPKRKNAPGAKTITPQLT